MVEDHFYGRFQSLRTLAEDGGGFLGEVHQDFSGHPADPRLDVGDLEDAGQQLNQFLEGLPEELGLDLQHFRKSGESLLFLVLFDQQEDGLVDVEDEALEEGLLLGL